MSSRVGVYFDGSRNFHTRSLWIFFYCWKRWNFPPKNHNCRTHLLLYLWQNFTLRYIWDQNINFKKRRIYFNLINHEQQRWGLFQRAKNVLPTSLSGLFSIVCTNWILLLKHLILISYIRYIVAHYFG